MAEAHQVLHTAGEVLDALTHLYVEKGQSVNLYCTGYGAKVPKGGERNIRTKQGSVAKCKQDVIKIACDVVHWRQSTNNDRQEIADSRQ
jgi:hypothetical protein